MKTITGKEPIQIANIPLAAKSGTVNAEYGKEYYERQDEETSYEKALEETRRRLFND